MDLKTNLFAASEYRSVKQRKGCFSVIEYEKDVSVSPEAAQIAYFSAEMNVRKKQLIIELDGKVGAIVQAKEMQMMMGDVEATTGVRGAGDLLKKMVHSAVMDETVIKPHYEGEGILVLEPTYRHILLEDMADWPEGIVTEDGMFLACEDTVEMEVTGRKNLSSLVLGREGIFNSTFYGKGILALESLVPREELIEVELEDNSIKIDGNMAVAWSPGLRFTVRKSMGTLIGSAVSGEGFVNVYEGRGKVLIAPVKNIK